MNFTQFITMCFLTLIFKINAQNDSVICGQNCAIKEGVYLNYSDFRNQNPLLKEAIESTFDKGHIDFIGKVLKEEKLNYISSGTRMSVDSKSVWGFYQNNSFHLNYGGEFYRVPMFGSISYLIATVEVINPGIYTPGYGGMMSGPTKTKELRNFLMNFYDGKIIPFSQTYAEELISRDAELYTEFKKLKPRQRKEQISRYIRKYNELHPVYFLK